MGVGAGVITDGGAIAPMVCAEGIAGAAGDVVGFAAAGGWPKCCCGDLWTDEAPEDEGAVPGAIFCLFASHSSKNELPLFGLAGGGPMGPAPGPIPGPGRRAPGGKVP